MDRYINVDSLIKSGWHLVKTGVSNIIVDVKSLADIPTEDNLVRVVRCNNCRYAYNNTSFCQRNGVYYCSYIDSVNDPNDYCSRGEPRQKAHGDK